MVNPNRFYTYAYLREDRTPYYIGKGCGKRIYDNKGKPCGKPKDKSRVIFLKQNLTEEEAFKHEIYMIAVFGRMDLGTGILHNKSNGGEGPSGFIHSEESKRKMSVALKGRNAGENNPNYGKSPSKETRRKMSEAKTGNNSPFYGKKGKNNPNYGIKRTEEFKRKQRELKKGENNPAYGKKWWNDDKGNIILSKECPGESWVLGMGNPKENHPAYGKKWWKDNCGNTKMSIECPGEGWIAGRGKIKWWKDNCGNTKMSIECPGEGWIAGRGKIKNKVI